jgi:hypothetical protein
MTPDQIPVRIPESVRELILDVDALRYLQKLYRQTTDCATRREIEYLEKVIDRRLLECGAITGHDSELHLVAIAARVKGNREAMKGGAR